MRGLSTAGQTAAAFGADVLGAAGVGHPQPYFATPSNNPSSNPPSNPANMNGQRPGEGQKPQGQADLGGQQGQDPTLGGETVGNSDMPAPSGDPYNMPPRPGPTGPMPGAAGPGGGGGQPGSEPGGRPGEKSGGASAGEGAALEGAGAAAL
jgi:translation initiation factor IF-2